MTIRQTTVHHFGPDPLSVGGMASVIRVLVDYRVGGDSVLAHPTWRPNSRLSSTLLTLSAAFTVMRMPTVHIAHIHLAEKGSFVREGALVVLARLRRHVTIVTIHGAAFVPFAQRYPWLVSRVLRRAQVITCLDSEVVDVVRSLAPLAHTVLVPNPVATDNHACSASATSEIVVFAGEIGLRKGADVLFRAWRLVSTTRPEARCLMIGPAKDFEVPDAERLEVQPSTDAATIRNLLRTARVVALPSRAEGMPMILTEAMSMGRPFVSTPVGGIPDLANEGGVLVPVEDDVALANSLIEFLANPQLAHEVGEQGRRFCLATRSTDVVGRQLRELYRCAAKA
jgi:glycosyltransferase involved in cell wall biosynthesis